jgi:hypothetical protein
MWRTLCRPRFLRFHWFQLDLLLIDIGDRQIGISIQNAEIWVGASLRMDIQSGRQTMPCGREAQDAGLPTL